MYMPPIIIGKAAIGFNPSKYTVTIVNAYDPIPMLFNAPYTKSKNPAKISFQPYNSVAVPFEGINFN